MTRLLPFVAAALLAAPLTAQELALDQAPEPDYAAARAAFASGEESGIRPQTRGEYMMCAAHWEALFRAQRGGMITYEAGQALGPFADTVDAKARSIEFIDKYGERFDAHWERFEQQTVSAGRDLIALYEGDAQAGARFFETLGVCGAA